MRKWGIAATAALLVLAGGVARAQESPNEGGTSVPGSEPGTKPVETRSIEVTNTVLTVDGKTVDEAPAGVNVVVILTLRNNLASLARNVRVHAEEIDEGRTRITDADADAGDIAPGKSDTVRLGVVADKSGCESSAYFGGEISYDGGTAPFNVGYPVACPGPRLGFKDVTFSGGDGDNVPEPGETLRVTIVLINEGRDAATGVRAKVTVKGDDVSTKDEDLAWPDMAPGKSAANVTPFTIVVGDNAQRQTGSCDDVKTLPAPAEDQGSLPPDSAVSSDGTVSSPAATASDQPASSEPGSAGGEEPGSTGSGTAIVIEPTTGTIEPEPEPATVKPAPEPGTIEPQPEPADQSVVIEMNFVVTASGYETEFGFSTQRFCTLEARTGTDKLGAPVAAWDDAAGSTGSGAALPVSIAILASAAAVGGRRALAR